MVYYTQLIFVQPRCTEAFHEFESRVLPLLKYHQGELITRVRPSPESFIEGTLQPYEIHVVRFPSTEYFNSYSKDPNRLAHVSLKNESIERVILLEGIAL